MPGGGSRGSNGYKAIKLNNKLINKICLLQICCNVFKLLELKGWYHKCYEVQVKSTILAIFSLLEVWYCGGETFFSAIPSSTPWTIRSPVCDSCKVLQSTEIHAASFHWTKTGSPFKKFNVKGTLKLSAQWPSTYPLPPPPRWWQHFPCPQRWDGLQKATAGEHCLCGQNMCAQPVRMPQHKKLELNSNWHSTSAVIMFLILVSI